MNESSSERIAQKQTKTNKALTPNERRLKRELKKNVKAFHRINKLSKKIKHAQSRRDPKTEQEARIELKKLVNDYKLKAQQQLEEDEDLFEQLHLELPFQLEKDAGLCANQLSSDDFNEQNENQTECKKIILSIYNQVMLTQRNEFIKDTESTSEQFPQQATKELNKREVDISNIRNLLQHMTKGTQSRNMFRDIDVLWGYARQKFNSRAMLVVTSLLKLKDDPLPFYNAMNLDEEKLQSTLNSQLFKNTTLFQMMKDVRSVCSIGCGPGNDIVGFLSFFKLTQSQGNATTSLLESPTDDFANIRELVMLDFAMGDWIQLLTPILDVCKNSNDPLLSSTCNIIMDECDVTKPIFVSVGDDSFASSDSGLHAKKPCNSANSTAAKYGIACDMFLISYLLSETRGLWEEFMLQLVDSAKAGSIFYFAEPTPWQLHHLISLFNTPIQLDKVHNNMNPSNSSCHQSNSNGNGNNSMKFLWIDSSMKLPAMQGLHSRLGPAVLLGIKV